MRNRIGAYLVVVSLALIWAPSARAVTGDLDDSGLVDGWDLITFARAFGADAGNERWNARADLDGSGIVDGDDLSLLVANFGRSRSFDTYSRIGQATGPDHLSDQIVVQFLPEMGTSAMQERATSLGGNVRTVTPSFVTVGIDTAAGDTVEAAVARFSADSQVVYAEPDYLRYLHFRPNDPYFSDQWHMAKIDYESGLDIQAGSAPQVIVAVIDTGVAYENRGVFRKATDLTGTAFVAGPDLVDNDGHPNDEGGDGFGHGTFVTGVIAATTNNNFGTAGIAYNATIMPVRVFARSGAAPDSRIAQGIDAAVAGGARILNMSFGGAGFSTTLRQSVQRAYAAGVTMVASAGNAAGTQAFTGDSEYPAAFPEVIGVAATDFRDARAPYSNYGPSVDVAAPGGDNSRDDNGDGNPDGILAQSFINNQYSKFQFFWGNGTSFSAPHVTGIAALLYARGVTHPEAIRNTILLSARDVGPDGKDHDTGYGVASARRALEGLGPD